MSRAAEKSTKMDGLEIVPALLGGRASRPKYSVYSRKNSTIQKYINKGSFLIKAIICWSAHAFIGVKWENRFLNNFIIQILLAFYFAATTQEAENR